MIILRIKYLLYVVKWKIEHSGKAFAGMEPAFFDEWFYNEFAKVDD